MADVDDSINKISLQDKVKLLDSLKKVRGAELKEKGAKISKEIDELEEKRKKEMKALEEQLKKEESELDEEMMKAMDALFFRDRRTYLMNRARVERKQEIDTDSTEHSGPRGESFLYDISEKIFAGQNLKLHEIISFEAYSKRKEEDNRGYLSSQRDDPAEHYRRGAEENKYESSVAGGGYPEPSSGMYSSRPKSLLERFDDEWGTRRNY